MQQTLGEYVIDNNYFKMISEGSDLVCTGITIFMNDQPILVRGPDNNYWLGQINNKPIWLKDDGGGYGLHEHVAFFTLDQIVRWYLTRWKQINQ